MPLQSQRFRGQATLEGCLAGTRTLTLDDPDSEAVHRVQDALSGLGYLVWTGSDGLFGKQTGKAVSAFKKDSGLQPTDPVVGKGTMAALDAIFASESASPDAPDPGTGRLPALASAAAATAAGWAQSARNAMQQYNDPDPADVTPGRVAFEAALERDFGAGAGGPGTRDPLMRYWLAPMVDGMAQLLGSPNVLGLDQPGFRSTSQRGIYRACSGFPGLTFAVTPPFANVLSGTVRATEMLRVAAEFCYYDADIKGVPGTPRFSSLQTGDQIRNVFAYVAFCHELATGATPPVGPPLLWYP